MSEKIHPPTPRKRQRAIEQGRGPRSGEVATAGTLLAATALLSWTGPSLAERLMDGLSDSLQRGVLRLDDRWQPVREIAATIAAAALALLPIVIAIMLCGIGLHLLQSGWRTQASKLAPAAERLSPGMRIRAMFHWRSLGGLAITLLKLVALAAVFLLFLRETLPQFLRLPAAPLATIGPTIFHALTDCCLWMGATMLAFACVDYALAWWRFERELMMTEQELREELRDMQRPQIPTQTTRSQPVQAVS